MCGIAGEVRFDGGVFLEPLHAIALDMLHRGPDDHGLWRSEDGFCGFSFRRLSIIDLSKAGHQPMLDPETGNAIVFNGEIYNFKLLREQCIEAGCRFRSQTDTEVILALYRQYGRQCIDKLRGMFAFALWDAQKRELFFARDRLGKKPLNYALTDKGLVFCSEIDPLVQHPDVSDEMDVEALDLYLQLQYVPVPWSIYRQIRKLPPAHFAVFDRFGLHIEKYWTLDYSKKSKITEEEALDALREKITEAVKLRMIADVPLGALLSGGVDSSFVVSTMAGLSSSPIRTFSIGFEENAFNELPYANQVAKIYQTEHHPQIVLGDVNSVLPRLVRHYGEPFADSSAIPSFLVCEAARRNVTVALNGDGGDELLGGYRRHRLWAETQAVRYLLGRMIPVKTILELAAQLPYGIPLASRTIGRLARELIHPELGTLFSFASFWSDAERHQLLPSAVHSSAALRWRLAWFAQSVRQAYNSIDRMLYIDQMTYLPDDLLVKMDIASMHCSLEARSPLLDHELMEFCASLPSHFKVQGHIGKYLLKRLAESRFPKSFVYRRKMGFGVPVGTWLKGSLREQLLDTIFDFRLMAPLEAKVIDRIAKTFLSGSHAHFADVRVWILLVYGLWKRHLTSRKRVVTERRGGFGHL